MSKAGGTRDFVLTGDVRTACLRSTARDGQVRGGSPGGAAAQQFARGGGARNDGARLTCSESRLYVLSQARSLFAAIVCNSLCAAQPWGVRPNGVGRAEGSLHSARVGGSERMRSK